MAHKSMLKNNHFFFLLIIVELTFSFVKMFVHYTTPFFPINQKRNSPKSDNKLIKNAGKVVIEFNTDSFL